MSNPLQAVTEGPRPHFFGYYDKSPWNPSMSRMLALEPSCEFRSPAPEDEAAVGIIDLAAGKPFTPVARTTAWCWQQSGMLHWFDEHRILYNTCRDGRLAAVVQDLRDGAERVYERPAYALDPSRRRAVSASFPRVAATRPGYGYSCLPDPFAGEPAPSEDGVWITDLETGSSRLLVSFARLAATVDVPGAVHWVNHLQFNTDGTRFVFLHRWQSPQPRTWSTRMFTCGVDGNDLFLLNGDGMTSHFDWRDPEYLVAWARQRDRGDRYFLFRDRTRDVSIVGESLFNRDGHCVYSPDRRWMLTDTYADPGTRLHELMLFDTVRERRIEIARVYEPPVENLEWRCDLHTRWSPDGRRLCFDSQHTGQRQVYVLDIAPLVEGREEEWDLLHIGAP